MRKAIMFCIGCFLFNIPVIAADFHLSTCASEVCQKVILSELNQTATVVIWSGQGEIMKSQTFKVGKGAKIVAYNSTGGTNSVDNLDEAPPSPCTTGACALPVVTTVVTPTHIITYTITYQYANGVAINATVSETRTPRPPDFRDPY